MQEHTPQLALFTSAPHDPTLEIPYGFCECGCGQKTKVATQDSKPFGHVKGVPVRFLPGHQFKHQPIKTLAERLWARVKILGPDDCWEWQGYKDELGYGKIKVGPKYGPSVGTHRAAYELTYGPLADGHQACHTCDNPPCCNPKHLFDGTNADNIADKVAKGRQARGEKGPGAKLTAEQVTTIRQRYGEGDTSIDKLAAQYGMAATTISNIIHRKKWKHVP